MLEGLNVDMQNKQINKLKLRNPYHPYLNGC